MAATFQHLLTQLKAGLRNNALARNLAGLLEQQFGGAASVTYTIGAESGADAIVVSLQFSDQDGDEIASRQHVQILLLADANGDALNTNNYTIAAGTDGVVAEVVADKVLSCITEADGDLDISLTIAGDKTCYLAWVGPGGKLHVSGAITHDQGTGT